MAPRLPKAERCASGIFAGCHGAKSAYSHGGEQHFGPQFHRTRHIGLDAVSSEVQAPGGWHGRGAGLVAHQADSRSLSQPSDGIAAKFRAADIVLPTKHSLIERARGVD